MSDCVSICCCSEALTKAKFDIRPSPHPIVPVMLGTSLSAYVCHVVPLTAMVLFVFLCVGDARLASQFADRMLDKGIYVIGFSYPVVPKDKVMH